MSYLREDFAAELEGILDESLGAIDHEKIAAWAYRTRLTNLSDIEPEVGDWLLQFGAMSMGPEFEFSESELRDLISKARI